MPGLVIVGDSLPADAALVSLHARLALSRAYEVDLVFATASTDRPARPPYAYYHFGRRTTTTDPLGATTAYAYTDRGDLGTVRDAAGGVTRYQYDGEHHLVQVQSPKGHVTRLEWGGYHRLCVRTDANGHKVRLGYNVEGELTHVWNEEGEVLARTGTALEMGTCQSGDG